MKTQKSRQATIFKKVQRPFWDDDNWVVATQIFVYVHPYLGKLMIQIDNIFEMGWNHQLDKPLLQNMVNLNLKQNGGQTVDFQGFCVVNVYSYFMTHRIHVWHISLHLQYIYIVDFYGIHVGPMDPMGAQGMNIPWNEAVFFIVLQWPDSLTSASRPLKAKVI